MKLRLRLLLLVICSLFQERLRLVDEHVLNLRVWPTDIDVTRVTTDRYFALSDLGRINIALRGGMLRTLVASRWIPVARSATLRFRHPLKLFQRFQLRSKVVYWDDEWIWVEHRFERNGRTVAVTLCQVTFFGPKGLVPVPQIFAAAGEATPSPTMPQIVADLRKVEQRLKETQK